MGHLNLASLRKTHMVLLFLLLHFVEQTKIKPSVAACSHQRQKEKQGTSLKYIFSVGGNA